MANNDVACGHCSTFSRCFWLGLGFGSGIAVIILVTRRYLRQTSEQNSKHEVIKALQDISKEIHELRLVIVKSQLENVSIGKIPQVYDNGHSEEIAGDILLVGSRNQQESSSEDGDFYDLQDDQDVSTFSLPEKSHSIVKVFEECDTLCLHTDNCNEEQQIQMLEDALQNWPDNPDILWRLARAFKLKLFCLSGTNDPTKEKEIIEKAISFTQQALLIDHENGDAHKWAAILIGLQAERQTSISDKATSAQKMQDHISKAVEFKPKDSTVHFLMGRFLFEFADLPWWQKQTAGYVFELPSCSYEDALSSFEKADKLSDGKFKSNMLFMGKCYQRLGDYVRCNEWLKKCLDVPIEDSEDRKSAEEATQLLLQSS